MFNAVMMNNILCNKQINEQYENFFKLIYRNLNLFQAYKEAKENNNNIGHLDNIIHVS